jgi:hypothetical protein
LREALARAEEYFQRLSLRLTAEQQPALQLLLLLQLLTRRAVSLRLGVATESCVDLDRPESRATVIVTVV